MCTERANIYISYISYWWLAESHYCLNSRFIGFVCSSVPLVMSLAPEKSLIKEGASDVSVFFLSLNNTRSFIAFSVNMKSCCSYVTCVVYWCYYNWFNYFVLYRLSCQCFLFWLALIPICWTLSFKFCKLGSLLLGVLKQWNRTGCWHFVS